MELMKMHNDFVDLPLRRFNSSEIDLLHGICFRTKEQGSAEIDISFQEIKGLAHYQGKDKTQLIKDIENTNRKLMALDFKLEDEHRLIQFVLFPTFKIDKDNEILTVKVNEPFQYLLNEFSGNYTSFELEQSAQLRSSYSKQIYKRLRQFRSTGIWRVTMAEFRRYLDIPDSYKTINIQQRVLDPALRELSEIFDGLQVERIYEKNRKGSGRKKVSGFVFTFTPSKNIKPEPSQARIAKVTGWEKTGRFCPKCKREVYKKMLENELGTYYLYGHTDFKTGECDYTTYDYADLLEEYQLEPAEPSTPEQERNKAKLSDMLKGLFGVR